MKKRPVHVAELIARLVASKTTEGVARRAPGRRTFEVFRAFERIGPPLTDHAEPSSYRQGRLTLRVRSSAWLTELGMMQAEIVRRLNSVLPKPWVDEVRLVLGSPRSRAASAGRPPGVASRPRLSPRQRDQVALWTQGLRDERVRDAFTRAAERSLASGPVGPEPVRGPPGPRVMPVPAWVEPEDLELGLTYGYGEREVDRWRLSRNRPESSDDEEP